MSIKPQEFEQDWSAGEFYHLILFLSWEAHAHRNYAEIMAAKSRSAK